MTPSEFSDWACTSIIVLAALLFVLDFFGLLKPIRKKLLGDDE